MLTWLGSGWVVYPLGVLTAIALAVRRYWMEFWALVVGLALIAFFVPEIKVWTDRPRPPDRLISVHSPAFPSGHAAQSTFYVWLAVTLASGWCRDQTRSAVIAAASGSLVIGDPGVPACPLGSAT